MNYIWDTAIKAARQGIAGESITFASGKSYSPYMEMAFDDINTVTLDPRPTVEINPYYRFGDIFHPLLDINFTGHDELKSICFDIIVHFLLFLDCKQGLNKHEYYVQFIRWDIENGVFGPELKENSSAFTGDELTAVLSSLITLYRTQASLYLFKQVVRRVFHNSIIYYRSEDAPEVLIYLGAYATEINRRKINTLLALFLPLDFAFRLYWEKHFGIIGQEPTMGIDNIILY
ncbi:Hypothetical protein LUCI_4311 [Lucifera butyrica]|uniref:Uncharacterized protein n=1 Tax=Lucifera butyrica TaxID=1351585 RepID=A0A498RDI7_9FIRM|nr:iron-dependent peroxidase [Lucifera butyrica]VBB09025.1 Hypothetical protein LUCI_4311 [Lucifera butyrica]